MTEGELKKRIEVWGELHKKIFRLSNNVLLKSKSEAVTEILKMPNAHSPFEDVLQILEVLDEAKQEFPKEDDFMACEGDDDNCLFNSTGEVFRLDSLVNLGWVERHTLSNF